MFTISTPAPIASAIRKGLTLLCILLLSACFGHPSAPVSDLSPLQSGLTAYKVKKGDTLYSISFRTGKDYKRIAAWNNISAPYLIYVNDQLRLTPPPRQTIAQKKQPSPKVKTNTTSKRKPTRTQSLPAANLPSKVAKWAWPAKGKLIAKYAKARGINGIQIAANSATAVNSAAAGQVVYAGTGIRGYGQLLIVKHSEEFLSAYAHNKRILVKEGQRVSRGQQIAEMGSTGTNKTKLHFEIRKNGQPVNPLKYLPLKRG